MELDEKEVLACCGSTKFAREMVLKSPFPSLDHAVSAARDIWFNKADVSGSLAGWKRLRLIPRSETSLLLTPPNYFCSWSKGEQSTALATATDSSLQELAEWNARFKQKFVHIFIICPSGRSTAEILAELKRRCSNRPIVEIDIAAAEQMKVRELRLANLFSSKAKATSTGVPYPTVDTRKAGSIFSFWRSFLVISSLLNRFWILF